MSSRLIIALDFPTAEQALAFVKPLDPQQCKLKVGFELFVAAGPDFVRALVQQGFAVFLDLKFHDIPNTVASACKAAAQLGVWMINVHASGGAKMMQAAQQALQGFENPLGSRPVFGRVNVLHPVPGQHDGGSGRAENHSPLCPSVCTAPVELTCVVASLYKVL